MKHWTSWVGMVLYLYLLVTIFKFVDAESHSVSDTLTGLTLPFIALTGLFVLLILQGQNGSRGRE